MSRDMVLQGTSIRISSQGIQVEHDLDITLGGPHVYIKANDMFKPKMGPVPSCL